MDLYLVIVLVSAENAVSHKYVIAKGCIILTAFCNNNENSEVRWAKILENVPVQTEFLGVYIK